MSDVIIFSHLYPRKAGNFLIDFSKEKKLAIANENYEKGIILAISRVFPNQCFLINRVFINRYPRFSCIAKMQKTSISFGEVSGINVAFNNRGFSQLLFKEKSVEKELLSCNLRDENLVFVFTNCDDGKLYSFVKKRFPQSRSLLFLPDLPQSFLCNKRLSFFRSIHVKQMIFQFTRGLRSIDYLFPISSHMIKFLNFSSRKSFPFEGAYFQSRPSAHSTENPFIISYLGSTNLKYGVLDLIQGFLESAFSRSYRLFIGGSGDGDEQIRKIAAVHKNLVFLGFVAPERAKEIERNSTLLVVCESGKDSFSKYSFHSKITEFMSSGTPTLVSFYGGLPNEYHRFLLEVPIRDDMVSAYRDALNDSLSRPFKNLLALGFAAQDFLFSQKSPDFWAGKISKFLAEQKES